MTVLDKFQKDYALSEIMGYIDAQCLDCGGLGNCLQSCVVYTSGDEYEDCDSWRNIPKILVEEEQS